MADEKTYQVTVTYAVKATTPTEAALQAYSLNHDLTPTDFAVTDPDGKMHRIRLTEDEEAEALDRAFKGTLFPSD